MTREDYDGLRDNILKVVNENDPMHAVNQIREILHDLSPLTGQPVDLVRWVPIDDVTPNDYNPNAVAVKEMSLLLTSVLADGYCVEASTPILCADLIWRRARDLRQGDLLVGVTEEGTGTRLRRQYIKSIVVSNGVTTAPLYRVSTTRGSVLTNAEHPWLTRKTKGAGALAYGNWHWRATRDLTAGFEVAYAMDTWSLDVSWESGWLAGFLDGEGTLSQNQNLARNGYRSYRLAAYQRPGNTADQMVKAIRNRVPDARVFTVERQEHSDWSDMVMCRVDKLRDIMRLLGTVRPLRLLERGDFWHGSRFDSQQNIEVLGVEPDGEGEIANLSTSSRTYIANGFVMHNTQPIVTVWDASQMKFVIVDGFHRYFVCKTNPEVNARCRGMVPIVVIDKDIAERMAATVRHNRARGKHSVQGMAKMVFEMMAEGKTEADICNELGMQPEEVNRLKHLTGFSKLFEDTKYSRSWTTRHMTIAKLKRAAAAKAAEEMAKT